MNIRNALLAATFGAASALFAMPALAKKLHVGNLAFSVDEEDLQNKFQTYGTVQNVHLPRTPEGRPRGFGYVDMSSETEADAAIAALNGVAWNGRQLTVTRAVPREAKKQPGRPREGSGR